MYDEDIYGSFKYSSPYSTISMCKFGSKPFAENRNTYYEVSEYLGLVYCYCYEKKTMWLRKKYRILSWWDVEVLKSNLLNDGYNINWDTFDIIRTIFNEVASNGRTIVMNTDYCYTDKVIPNK